MNPGRKPERRLTTIALTPEVRERLRAYEAALPMGLQLNLSALASDLIRKWLDDQERKAVRGLLPPESTP